MFDQAQTWKEPTGSVVQKDQITDDVRRVRLRRIISALANDQTNGGTLKPKDCPQLIFQIPLIGKMKQLGIVAKNHKRRGFHGMPTWVM